MRKPFIIYKRENGRRRVYHVGFWDNYKKDYSVRRSADTMLSELEAWGEYSVTSKTEVDALARLYIKRGFVKAGCVGIDFLDYIESFWKEDSDYVVQKRISENISTKYINGLAGVVKNYIKPFFNEVDVEKRYLTRINTEILEKCLLHIYKKTESIYTVQQAKKAMSKPLSEAFRLKKILENPMTNVRSFTSDEDEKGIFTIAEAKKFLNPSKWTDKRLLVINLLAASSGARLGECRALNPKNLYKVEIEDMQIPCIDIVPKVGNWVDEEGYKDPKWDSARIVPIPEAVYNRCLELVEENPWKNDFVFYSTTLRDKPIGKTEVRESFNEVCANIGIKDRDNRKISFHSWRHWYDTMVANELPGELRRRLTGHTDEKMDKRYIHFTDEHRKMLSEMSNKIFN